MKYIIQVNFFLLFAPLAFSQKAKTNLSIDTFAVWELRKVTRPLSLDSNQLKYFFGVTKNYLYQLDKIKKNATSDSSRILASKKSRDELVIQLKAFLSKEQFDKYILMQETTKQEFIKRQSKRKVQVKSMDFTN